jgi:hypothetical protein
LNFLPLSARCPRSSGASWENSCNSPSVSWLLSRCVATGAASMSVSSQLAPLDLGRIKVRREALERVSLRLSHASTLHKMTHYFCVHLVLPNRPQLITIASPASYMLASMPFSTHRNSESSYGELKERVSLRLSHASTLHKMTHYFCVLKRASRRAYTASRSIRQDV